MDFSPRFKRRICIKNWFQLTSLCLASACLSVIINLHKFIQYLPDRICSSLHLLVSSLATDLAKPFFCKIIFAPIIFNCTTGVRLARQQVLSACKKFSLSFYDSRQHSVVSIRSALGEERHVFVRKIARSHFLILPLNSLMTLSPLFLSSRN